MSSSVNGTHAPAGPWRQWLHFWFAPVDPTTLGFIRLVTGFAVVYIHLAYCFDLRSFFGPDGWYNLASVNRERTESPSQIGEFWGREAWEESMKGASVPEYPHRKRAVMAYLRAVTADPARVEPALAYLDRLQRFRDDGPPRAGLDLLSQLPDEPGLRKAKLDTYVNKDKVPPEARKTLAGFLDAPDFLANLPDDGPDGRATVAKEIEAFYQSLPADPDDRRFVLTHLFELNWTGRDFLMKFIREAARLPEAVRAERLGYLEYWHSERKFAFRVGSPIFSQWFHISDPAGMAAAHAAALAVMLMFAVGLFTRVTSVLTWLIAVGYIHRTQQVLFGMDTMMNILLIYLMVGNSGAALSVDRLIARYRVAKASLRRTGTIDAATQRYLDEPPPSVSAGFALRLLQVHFCFIYMAAGLSKLKGGAWWNTNAYWDTLVNPEFTLIHFRWYETLVRAMSEQRPFYAAAAAGGVAFTFIAEIGLPFLVWTRLRPWVVMMGFLLHAGVAIFMGLWIFSLLMMTMLLGYIPGCCIRDRLFGSRSAGANKLTVRFDRKSDRQVRAAALARAADFDNQVEFADGPAVRVQADGQEYADKAAARELFRRLSWLKGFGWLLWVPGVSGLFTGGRGGLALPKPPVPAGR